MSASAPGATASGWGGSGRRAAVDDADRADDDDEQGQAGEQVGRDGEDVARLPEPPKVADRDEADRDERDLDPEVVGLRDDRLDLLDGRGRRHRHCHDVIDEEGRRRDEPEDRGEVLASDDVGAAAVRVGPADLAVGERDHGQHHDDGDRHADRVGERAGGRGDDEDAEDLLGRVGRRADRVGAEDRQRLDLGQALADLLLRRQGTAEDDRPDTGDEPAGGRERPAGGLLGDERSGAGVSEVGGVRTFDPHPPVRDLAPGERAPAADHRRRAAVKTVFTRAPFDG